MKVTAWIGAGFMTLSLLLYIWVMLFMDHTQDPLCPTMDFSFAVPMPFAMISVPLMLIGGFWGRPKYYWIISLVAGLFYIVVFFPIISDVISKIQHTSPAYRMWDRYIFGFSISIVPGLLLIIEGAILYIKRNKPVQQKGELKGASYEPEKD